MKKISQAMALEKIETGPEQGKSTERWKGS